LNSNSKYAKYKFGWQSHNALGLNQHIYVYEINHVKKIIPTARYKQQATHRKLLA